MKRLHCTVEFNNGETMTVDTTTADYLRYETTAKRNGWPPMLDAPARWEAFSAWSALERTGQFKGSWEDFLNAVDVVDGTPRKVDPTGPANTEG